MSGLVRSSKRNQHGFIKIWSKKGLQHVTLRGERERRTRGQQKRAKMLQPLLSSTEIKEQGLKTKPELSLSNHGYHLTSLMYREERRNAIIGIPRDILERVLTMGFPPAIKYHGLENQGSTCYLNSVLQVLFMTKDFREAVERLPSENTKHIDLQLQSLFGDLKSRTAKTNDITKKLGIKDVYRRQDAAEYYEKNLRLTSDDASKIFHGQLTHMTRCSSCGTKTGADRAFWHLPLALEDSYLQIFCVVKGIKEFFRASHSNGENQIYCNGCDAWSYATKCVIKHHPEVLTLLLKRFELDHFSDSYVKKCCNVKVPWSLSLQIPENQTYRLYAMVEHSGDLSSGQYIATIKSEDDGRWYSFDDKRVRLILPQPFEESSVVNSSSAYLLFYRKKKVPAAGTQVFREESTPGGSPLSTWETQDQRPAGRRHAGIRTFRDTSPEESVSNMWSPAAARPSAGETAQYTMVDVSRQQDAAEYYEKILRLTSDDASKIFHGQLTHKTRCSSCGTKTDADRAFLHLPLALEDSYSQNYSVEKGIEEFFRASHSNGENQIYCDGCRAKSDATTKHVIKHHPEVLTLLLKRFEFDHYYNRYVKVNCTVDVPFTLQIPENQPYELYAMVEHSGDFRSGHYIATIKSEDDGRWYSFNDKNVTLLDSQPFQSDKVEKSSSAYLLFYRKEKVPAAGTQDQSPAERREREEAEGTPEEGKDAAATAFINRDEGRIKDKAGVTSRKPGLSPDISNVESKEGQQKMWQAYGADVEQQGDGSRREQDVEVDKEVNTDPSPLIEDRRVDGRKQNMSKDRQGVEARRRSRDRRQPREDRRDIEGAKEQKRGDDKHAQRTETSMTEDQDRRGLDGVRQQKTSVPHVTPEDVDEERPAKEQERKPFPNRGDSSRKQFIVKTVGEETRKTCFGTQRSIETKIIGIKTRGKPAQQERLSECFSDMKLSEQQKPGTKRHKVNVPTSAIDSNAERKPKVSDTQEQAAENQHAMKEIGEEEIKSRGHHALKEKNRNGKKKKITKQLFKLWKHADQTSESD